MKSIFILQIEIFIFLNKYLLENLNLNKIKLF